VNVDVDEAVKFAIEHDAFLEGVPYARYDRKKMRRPGGPT
jgi:hypothetical protein